MDLKELLGEELFSQVEAKLDGKKLMVDDGNFIPKSRFNEVNEAKKDLLKQLKEKDEQFNEISKKYSENKDLANELETLKSDKAKLIEEYENKIKTNEFNYALDSALTSAKCKNSKALKALLDIEGIKYQDGKLNGLEEQLNALKESDSYLFETSVPANTGGVGNFARGTNQITNPWAKETFNLTEQARLLKENPTLAAQFRNNI